MNWRDHLDIHPAAELFPKMSEAELKELADDIERNGLQADIVFWSPAHKPTKLVLLDGRSRLDALAVLDKLEIDAKGRLAIKGTYWSPRAISLNIHRPAKKQKATKARRRRGCEYEIDGKKVSEQEAREFIKQSIAMEEAAENRAIALLVEHLNPDILKEVIVCLRQCSMCVDKLEQAAQQKIGKAAHSDILPSAPAATPDDYPDMPDFLRRTPKEAAVQ